MNHEQIAALTFNPFLAFERLVDISVILPTEQSYSWPQGYTGERDWDNCAVHPKLLEQVGGNKPTDDELLAGPWADYIAELTAAEDARLAEIERVNNIKQRWSAMIDIRANLIKANIEIINPADLLNQIIEQNDIATLELLESKQAEIESDLLFAKKKGKQEEKIKLGFSVVALMGALNESKNLTGEQTGAIVLALQTPMALFTSGSTNTAIGYVQGMTLPDGITEQDRSTIVGYAQAELAKIEAKYA